MKAPLFITLLLMMMTPALVYADAEINFSGTLVEEPCSLAPEDSAIEIDFGTVISKMLYSHKRTPGKPFTLHLLECDLSLGEQVNVTFLGNEDPLQPGLITLDAISTATGIAIGIETIDSNLVPINKPTENFKLHEGKNDINLQAFISGEEKAIKLKGISPGTFSSKSSFLIDYP